MQRPRKSATGKRPRPRSPRLAEEIAKLAAALERHATYILGHPFGKLWPDRSETGFMMEQSE